MGFSLQLVCPLLGVSHCLLPFLWLQGTGMPLVLLPPSWNGTVSYSHWQGRLLDEATSMGLRRWQREDGDKFYRQCACCASPSRKWDVLFKLKPRRGARDAPSIELSCRVRRVRSGSGRGTDATRFLAEFHGGLVRMLKELKKKSGGGWRRLSQKVEARGGKQQSSAGNSPSRWEYISDMVPREAQLDDWPDSPKMLTKESAATAPLPALTRSSIDLGSQSAHQPWESINMGPGVSWPLRNRPLTRAFACLELPQSSSSSCLPSLSQEATSPNNLPHSVRTLSQSIPSQPAALLLSGPTSNQTSNTL